MTYKFDITNHKSHASTLKLIRPPVRGKLRYRSESEGGLVGHKVSRRVEEYTKRAMVGKNIIH